MSTNPEMRLELAEIVRARHGEKGLTSATLINPSEEQIADYERHHGIVSLRIEIGISSHLIIVDTGNFIHMRHAWIRNRQSEALRLVVSSGNQPVAIDRLRTHTYAQKIEGLELAIHFPNYFGQNRVIRYSDALRPLW